MPLKQHEFYVYHTGEKVYARRRDEAPVLAETLKTPQEAAAKVQSVVNPANVHHSAYDKFETRRVKAVNPETGIEEEVDAQVNVGLGYNDPDFQGRISANCEKYVNEAYAKVGK